MLAGLRLGAGSERARAFGEVLAGVLGAKVSLGSLEIANASALTVEPGFGVELSNGRTVGIRPQFNVLISRLNEQTGADLRFTVNLVIRIFH